jgi:hypothetical protein
MSGNRAPKVLSLGLIAITLLCLRPMISAADDVVDADGFVFEGAANALWCNPDNLWSPLVPVPDCDGVGYPLVGGGGGLGFASSLCAGASADPSDDVLPEGGAQCGGYFSVAYANVVCGTAVMSGGFSVAEPPAVVPPYATTYYSGDASMTVISGVGILFGVAEETSPDAVANWGPVYGVVLMTPPTPSVSYPRTVLPDFPQNLTCADGMDLDGALITTA